MEALYIIFGWALGLFGGPVARKISRGHERKDLGRAISRELRHFRFTLATVADQLADHCVAYTEDLIEDLRSAHADPGVTDEKALPALAKTIETPVETLNAVAAARRKPGIALRVRGYGLPFLESQTGRIDLFSVETQERLNQILAQHRMYNEDAEYAMSLFNRSFDPALTLENRGITAAELEDTYRRMLRRAQGLMSVVSGTLGSLGK